MKLTFIIAAITLTCCGLLSAQGERKSKPAGPASFEVEFTSATVLVFRQGASVTLKLDNGDAKRFRLAALPVIFSPAGVAVETPRLSRGTHVLVHFMQENEETLVDRILIQP